MANIDVRVGNLITSDQFKRLRQIHIDNDVLPGLDKIKEEFVAVGIDAEIDIMVEDGNPVEQIIKIINDGGYSSLIMQRSDKSAVEKMFIGSVTAGILHHESNATIYLPPAGNISEQNCPPENCLIALDGSKNSQAAMQRAEILAAACGDSLKNFILAMVLDIGECNKTLAQGQPLKSPDSEIVQQAAEQLIAAGISSERIIQNVSCGDPGSVLADLVKQYNVDAVFMGRRDRSAVKELFMSSVSSKIIQQCQNQTIVLVNAD
jgi:nucleotide-binding universal stress UspA family protein